MIYSKELEEMCTVAKGVNHGPAPIPEEGKWVKAKEIKDISGLTHGIGWCAPQQGACKLTLNVKDGIIQEALIETIGCSGMTHSAAMAGEILTGKTILEALNTDLVCDAINTAMRELFLQIVYGRTQTAFSEGGLPVGAGLEDLGKGHTSQVGTIYSSTLTQVPLADSIFIPMHGETGAIKVDTVGGDVNLKDAIDLDYFRDKLHSALRIPAPYLSYTETLPGGIGDSSLTRMDIRYSRTITRIQSILAEGLRDICVRYLELTIGERALAELPDFKIKFTSINSAEDASRAELQKTFMETLQQTLSGLKELGVDLATNSEGYKKTRDILLNQYFGSTLMQAIKEDETMMSVAAPQELADDKGNGSSPDSGPVPDSDFGGGPDFGADADLGDDDTDTSDLDVDANDLDTDTTNTTNERS